MDIVQTEIEKLEKNNSYIVSFGDKSKLHLITVIGKFENSSIIKFEHTGEEKILARWEDISLYDHVPVTHFRKQKLNKIENKRNDK